MSGWMIRQVLFFFSFFEWLEKSLLRIASSANTHISKAIVDIGPRLGSAKNQIHFSLDKNALTKRFVKGICFLVLDWTFFPLNIS